MANILVGLEKKVDVHISRSTADRASVAKDFIEKKYGARNERARLWQKLNNTMSELRLERDEQKMVKEEVQHREAQHQRSRRQKVCIYDFESLKVIGKGAFGEIRLVRYKPTSEIFAMKKMAKAEMLNKNHGRRLKAERDALSHNNDWLVSLVFSFQDTSYLYLVMEYLPGGDLMSYLIRKNILSEDETKFYIAEIVLAIDSVHRMSYIHRDLKPDNILIGKDGHIKLADFGLCKFLDVGDKCLGKKKDRKMAFSAVGTPEYLAPEVLSKQGYSEMVDWWSVGVILFEMLVGYPPFYADTPVDVCRKILKWKKHFKIPSNARMSPEAHDLICRLICDVNRRLSGLHDFKAHPFFEGIDWDHIRSSNAPFVPQLKSETDVSYFDVCEETESFYPTDTIPKKRTDSLFVGYNYKRETDTERSPLVTALEELEAIKQSVPL